MKTPAFGGGFFLCFFGRALAARFSAGDVVTMFRREWWTLVTCQPGADCRTPFSRFTWPDADNGDMANVVPGCAPQTVLVAISFGLWQALRLGLCIADSFGQHLAKLSLRLLPA